jgi:asparagine synthase (glutamine-hydrolysing)
MSGIAGIFNLDGRPAELQLLRRMTDAIAHRGSDGTGYWVRGAVGLGHRMLQATEESLTERQPLSDENGDVSLTWDGRLDNREDLRRELESKGFGLRTESDAELVLRAYQCWREECPARILGDFAFAIWDAQKKLFFCARDIVGARPLYYCIHRGTFLFASELHALLQDPTLPREPNDRVVAEYLLNAFTSQTETLFQGIFRLPQAHFLTVGPDRLRIARYWNLDAARRIRFRTDQEYSDAFLEIFREAVRSRLRSHRVVGSHLSGGLDSSSITCVAESLRRENVIPRYAGLETFSLVFPGLSCDESSYTRDLIEMWNLRSNQVKACDPDPNSYREEVSKYCDFPRIPSAKMFDPLMRMAHGKGIRVLLSGQWGDQWMIGSLNHNADLLRKFQFVKLARQISWDSSVLSQFDISESPLSVLLRHGILPLLPDAAKNAIKAALGKNSSSPGWVRNEFVHRTQLTERLPETKSGEQPWRSKAQREMYLFLSSGRSAVYREWEEVHASRFGLEVRYPFLDRRLIEFAFGLPEEQRWRRDQTRFAMRGAMRGLLPESIRLRTSKADFSHTLARALQILGGERFIDSLEISRLGWVDKGRVLQMYRQMIAFYRGNNPAYWNLTRPLWFIFGTELWLRYAFQQNNILSSRLNSSLTTAFEFG